MPFETKRRGKQSRVDRAKSPVDHPVDKRSAAGKPGKPDAKLAESGPGPGRLGRQGLGILKPGPKSAGYRPDLSRMMLARRAGISQSQVSRILTGECKAKWETMEKLAAAIGVSAGSLMIDLVERSNGAGRVSERTGRRLGPSRRTHK